MIFMTHNDPFIEIYILYIWNVIADECQKRYIGGKWRMPFSGRFVCVCALHKQISRRISIKKINEYTNWKWSKKWQFHVPKWIKSKINQLRHENTPSLKHMCSGTFVLVNWFVLMFICHRIVNINHHYHSSVSLST